MWWIEILLIALFGCQHSQPKVAPAANIVVATEGKEVQILVQDGESHEPTYAPSGDRLLYVSGKRASHSQPQIYEKNLLSGNERRITFQNGATYHPHYHPIENRIVYASSTDELKENPPLLQSTKAAPSPMPFPFNEQMELYLHSLSGLEIKRLTEHPGFDGDAHFSPDGANLFFTRAEGTHIRVLSFNVRSNSVHEIKNLGVNPSDYIVSPDGQFHAWLEWDESFGVVKLRLQNKSDPSVEIDSDHIVAKGELHFSPDSKWLLWTEKDPTTLRSDIWAVQLTNVTCPLQLTNANGVDRHDPVVSPDMQWLTYALVDKDRSRIARQPFQPPKATCSPLH